MDIVLLEGLSLVKGLSSDRVTSYFFPLFQCLTWISLSALFGILFFLFHVLWLFKLTANRVNFFSKFRYLHHWIVQILWLIIMSIHQFVIWLILLRSLMLGLIVYFHDLVVVWYRVIFALVYHYHLGSIVNQALGCLIICLPITRNLVTPKFVFNFS